MRLALIHGRRVAYELGGDPNGRPVLIIHGAWGGPTSTLWNGPRLRWQVPSDGLRLIAYDRRCAGLSQYDAEPFTLEDLARDAADLLDRLTIGRAAVLATSAGGPIGLRLALDYPDRVESLVLLNTGAALISPEPRGVDPADPFVADRLETVGRRLSLLDVFEREGIEAALAASAGEWRSPPEPPQSDPALAHARDNRRRSLRRLPTRELQRLASGALLNMQAQRGIDLLDQAQRISCPVLILHGDADTTVPIAFGQALAAAIPTAEFITLAGEGHGLIVHPRAQLLTTRWLSSVSSSHGQHRSRH